MNPIDDVDNRLRFGTQPRGRQMLQAQERQTQNFSRQRSRSTTMPPKQPIDPHPRRENNGEGSDDERQHDRSNVSNQQQLRRNQSALSNNSFVHDRSSDAQQQRNGTPNKEPVSLRRINQLTRSASLRQHAFTAHLQAIGVPGATPPAPSESTTKSFVTASSFDPSDDPMSVASTSARIPAPIPEVQTAAARSSPKKKPPRRRTSTTFSKACKGLDFCIVEEDDLDAIADVEYNSFGDSGEDDEDEDDDEEDDEETRLVGNEAVGDRPRRGRAGLAAFVSTISTIPLSRQPLPSSSTAQLMLAEPRVPLLRRPSSYGSGLDAVMQEEGRKHQMEDRAKLLSGRGALSLTDESLSAPEICLRSSIRNPQPMVFMSGLQKLENPKAIASLSFDDLQALQDLVADIDDVAPNGRQSSGLFAGAKSTLPKARTSKLRFGAPGFVSRGLMSSVQSRTMGKTTSFSRIRSQTAERSMAGIGGFENLLNRKRHASPSTTHEKSFKGQPVQISNYSIFKADPDNSPDTYVTIYMDRDSDENDFVVDKEDGVRHGLPLRKAIKAYKMTSDLDDEKRNSAAGSIVGGTGGSTGTNGGRQAGKPRLKIAVERKESPPPADPSVAAFVTMTGTNVVKKTATDDPQLPQQKKKRFRGWCGTHLVSFRNLMACTNMFILICAIAVIDLMSYFGAANNTNKSRLALIELLTRNLTHTVAAGLLLLRAQNIETSSYFIVNQRSIPSDVVSLSRSFYFEIMKRFPIPPEGLYAVDMQGNYNGVARYYDVSALGRQTVGPPNYQSRSVTPSSAPFLLSFLIPNHCDLSADQCIPDPSTAPITRAFYDVKTLPYFIKGVAIPTVGTHAWTQVYPVAERTLGFTSVYPVFVNTSNATTSPSPGTLTTLACADVNLYDISRSLELMTLSMPQLDGASADDSDLTLLYLVERVSGFLIATSRANTSLYTIDPVSARRLRPNESEDPQVKDLADRVALLRQDEDEAISFGSDELETSPADFLIKDLGDIIIVASPLRLSADLDWLLCARFPNRIIPAAFGSNYLENIIIMAFIVLFVSVISSFCLTRRLGRRLKSTAQQLIRIADLNFEEAFSPGGSDGSVSTDSSLQIPLGEYTREFNDEECSIWPYFFEIQLKEIRYIRQAISSMTTGLKSFSKYVPLDVVTLLVKMKREAVLGVDETELTIFFSDIANFTTISEQMTPTDLVVVMSEYLHEMSNIILESQGIVDKYIGDAIMAFWNAPLYVEDHAIVGCGAALKYQQRLRELRTGWIERGFPDISARIGMSTGKALVGNFGSPDRLSYTCLGDTVNLASRLEGLNKYYGTEIMISGAVFDAVQEHFVCRTLDSVAVKGKSVPSRVHELIGFRALASEALIQKIEVYEQAYNLYCEANFLEAKCRFEKFLRLQPDDLPAEKHVKECERMLENPPGTFWRPIVVLDEK